jgi:hypothetical protein
MGGSNVDYRSLFDVSFLGSWDVPAGKDLVLTIAKVEGKTLTSARGSNKKPVISFAEPNRAPMIANKTNSKVIATLYGKDVTKWIGKQIAVYATTTSVGGETTDCLRVRPMVPQQAGTVPEGKR